VVALAESLDADRLELANAQYLGWALRHRDALLPSAAQLARARAAAAAAKARLAGRMDVVFVLPDYAAGRPRACMSGWARRYVVIAPDGRVLPCQAAHTIAGLSWERVGTRPLAQIWRDSPSLVRFRGEAWMPEPCRSCDERGRDFGGCRCQAFALAGDAAATDPACARSPDHAQITAALAAAETATLGPSPAPPAPVYRHLQLAP
jgi:pyrroloquinoline quinone biosynthesis protein E